VARALVGKQQTPPPLSGPVGVVSTTALGANRNLDREKARRAYSVIASSRMGLPDVKKNPVVPPSPPLNMLKIWYYRYVRV